MVSLSMWPHQVVLGNFFQDVENYIKWKQAFSTFPRWSKAPLGVPREYVCFLLFFQYFHIILYSCISKSYSMLYFYIPASGGIDSDFSKSAQLPAWKILRHPSIPILMTEHRKSPNVHIIYNVMDIVLQQIILKYKYAELSNRLFCAFLIPQKLDLTT